jgi:nucleotide-binding universal stress UspA family protein
MKILLAVDSSAESDLAIKAVAARPWPQGATVEVLSVVESLYSSEVPNLMGTLKHRANETVQAAAQKLRSSGIEASQLVLCGNAKGAIVEHARKVGTGLIVVGSHRVTTIGQFLRGSVARAVVRFAPCSVEIVRGDAGPSAMKILVATDGSQYSEAAARSVAERPWPAGTEVRILSVADHHVRVSAIVNRPHFDAQAMEKLEAEAMKRAQEAVMSAEKIIIEGHLVVSGTVAVPPAAPREIILKEASDWRVNLIVVGSHGHGGLSRLVLGSTSEAVATCALCSVEVIR